MLRNANIKTEKIVYWRNNTMMLYPPLADLTEKTGSRYQLVNVVAKRAREISLNAHETETPLDKKPVSSAIDEIYTGKISIK